MKRQLITIKNLKKFYYSREKIIKLYNDYATIKSEAKYKAKCGEGRNSNNSCTRKRK